MGHRKGRCRRRPVPRELATSALVLRTRPYGESDRIVTLITEQHGKVTGIAKGAKNSRRRFAGTLEPFVLIRAVFRQRTTSDLVFLLRCELEGTLRAFELHLLAASGYAPALDRCRACGRAAEREDPRYLTLERGGLVCRRCVRVDEPVRPVAAATARELARLARSPLADAAAGIDAAILREAAAVTAQLIAAVTSGPVHSLGLLERTRVDSPASARSC